MLKLCGHQSPCRTNTLCTLLNYLSSFIRWHMAKQCQRLRVEIQGRGPQNKWLLFFEQPPLAEYLENTKRARGAISGGIINLNQPSHNTSPSVTLDNEFSGDAYKLVLFSATSEVFLYLCLRFMHIMASLFYQPKQWKCGKLTFLFEQVSESSGNAILC